MAAEFCEIWNIPKVPNPTPPYLHNPVNLGNYGTTAADAIINGAQPDAQRNPLPLPPQNVPFDHNFIPWNINPIDRNDLQHPIVMPANATVTNRNKLMALSKLFLTQNQYSEDVVFMVNRVGDTIYYLDGHPGSPPGPVLNANGQPAANQPGRYGIPFENIVAATVTQNLEKYFVFQSYSLLGSTQLVVRCEVDCVNPANNNALTEIKSRRGNPNYNRDYFRTVWEQMLFGCTESLVIGYHNFPNGNNPPTNFTNISTRTFAQVTQSAQLTPDDYDAMVGLASLVEWIRDSVDPGETRVFSFNAAQQWFVLSAPM